MGDRKRKGEGERREVREERSERRTYPERNTVFMLDPLCRLLDERVAADWIADNGGRSRRKDPSAFLYFGSHARTV